MSTRYFHVETTNQWHPSDFPHEPILCEPDQWPWLGPVFYWLAKKDFISLTLVLKDTEVKITLVEEV